LPQIGTAEIDAAIAVVLAGYGIAEGPPPRQPPGRAARAARAIFPIGRVKTPAS
jgi:hypothetical protein